MGQTNIPKMTTKSIPISELPVLELHEGDSILGAVSGGHLTVTVLERRTRRAANFNLAQHIKNSRKGVKLGRKKGESLKNLIHEGHRW